MAELKTPKGLIVGLIPPEMLAEAIVGETPKADEKPAEKPARGRKPKE